MSITREQLETYNKYMTDREREILLKWFDHGTQGAAAASLGIHQRNVERAWKRVRDRAAKQGELAEHDYATGGFPDGFMSRGESVLYNKEGDEIMRWRKSAPDRDRQIELMQEAIKGMVEDVPRLPEIAPPMGPLSEDVLTWYPVGDHHHGMLSWDKETGSDWDLKLSEKALEAAFDDLISRAMPSQTAVLAFLGDFLHYDSFETLTPRSKNQLDADSRFPKMVRSGIRMIRHAIMRVLQAHEHVHVIVEMGNHDPVSTIWFMELLAVAFEDNPRVTVDTSPMNVHYYEFGKNLFMTHHGDKIKMPQLPSLLAADQAEAWGRTLFRHIWVGHIHHQKVLQQDLMGATIEATRVLAPEDAWSRSMGYRSKRDMQAVSYHRERGPMSRIFVNPEIFE